MIRRYDFNAPAQHRLVIGDATYFGGAKDIELEEALAVDPRLTPSADDSEADAPSATAGPSAPVPGSSDDEPETPSGFSK